MHLFHVTEQATWRAATVAGAYAVSTRGRTLADEGFIHAAHENQVAGVLERFWADHPGPLVLLTIDTDLLTPPWRDEQVGTESFPHIFGAINPEAVIDVRPAPRAVDDTPAPPTSTFAQVWLAEFSFRIICAAAVMALAVALAVLAAWAIDEKAGLAGLAAGLAIGLAVVVPMGRRRGRQQ